VDQAGGGFGHQAGLSLAFSVAFVPALAKL
jgi:hypothetical protein